MGTPHEVARDLRERMESAKRAASNPEAGSVYAFEYLLSACEAACARLDLQAGSGEQCGRSASASRDDSDFTPNADSRLLSDQFSSAPAAGEGTCRHPITHKAFGCDCKVSDAEAEAVADAACGAPVDSHVPRAYVGPGPARLAARFPIHAKRGGR